MCKSNNALYTKYIIFRPQFYQNMGTNLLNIRMKSETYLAPYQTCMIKLIAQLVRLKAVNYLSGKFDNKCLKRS